MSSDFWSRRDGFWDRGGFWRAVLLAGGYLAIFSALSLAIRRVFDSHLDPGGALASTTNVVVLLLVPVALGALLIVGFLSAIGWLRPILGRQPIGGERWMWIAVVVLLYPAVLRLIGIQYDDYKAGVVATVLLLGLFVGIAEELVTRGGVVALLRKGG